MQYDKCSAFLRIYHTMHCNTIHSGKCYMQVCFTRRILPQNDDPLRSSNPGIVFVLDNYFPCYVRRATEARFSTRRLSTTSGARRVPLLRPSLWASIWACSPIYVNGFQGFLDVNTKHVHRRFVSKRIKKDVRCILGHRFLVRYYNH